MWVVLGHMGLKVKGWVYRNQGSAGCGLFIWGWGLRAGFMELKFCRPWFFMWG